MIVASSISIAKTEAHAYLQAVLLELVCRVSLEVLRSALPICDADDPGELLVHKVIDIFEYRVRRGEQLDKMTDGLANADDDDPEDAQRTEQPKGAGELEGLYVGDEEPGSYESAEHDELARGSVVDKKSGDISRARG